MAAPAHLLEIEGFWTREFALYLHEHQHPGNRLTHLLGIPIIVVTPVVALVTRSWAWLVGGLVVGWILQLLGHRLEGNKPAFLKRPVSFAMGPLMVTVELVGYLGLRPAFAEEARRLSAPASAPAPPQGVTGPPPA